METVIKKAFDPDTDQEYEIKLPKIPKKQQRKDSENVWNPRSRKFQR